MYGGNDKAFEQIADEVKETVIGQDEAVDWLCRFVDGACARANLIVEHGLDTLDLPNIGSALLVGPTASGKSHLLKTFARHAGMIFHSIDAGSVTGEGWSGNSFSSEWSALAGALAENPGKMALVFLDEVDKMVAKGSEGSEGNAGFNPKFDLLKPLEGGTLSVNDTEGRTRRQLDCDRCVFVLAGAFTGIEETVSRRLGYGGNQLGFAAQGHGAKPDESALRAQVTLDDIEEWGFPRELVGRLSTVRCIQALGGDALRSIVLDCKVPEYDRLLGSVDFAIDDAACDLIVRRAQETHYGARSINQQINEVVLGGMRWDISHRGDVVGVTLTARDGRLSYDLREDAEIANRRREERDGRRGNEGAVLTNARMQDMLDRAGRYCEDYVLLGPPSQLFEDPAREAAVLMFHTNCVTKCPDGTTELSMPFSLCEITLLSAMIYLLLDWFPRQDFMLGSIRTLLSMARFPDMRGSALGLLYGQISSGTKPLVNDSYIQDPRERAERMAQMDPEQLRREQPDSAVIWVPSQLRRNTDGMRPADCDGLPSSQDRALAAFESFMEYPEAVQERATGMLALRLVSDKTIAQALCG